MAGAASSHLLPPRAPPLDMRQANSGEEKRRYESQSSTIYSHVSGGAPDGLSIIANGIQDVPQVALRDTWANVTCISMEYAVSKLGYSFGMLKANKSRISTSNGGSGKPVGFIPAGQILFVLKHGTSDKAITTYDVYVMQNVGSLYDCLIATRDLMFNNAWVDPRQSLFVYCPDMHSKGSWARSATCPMRCTQTRATAALVQAPEHGGDIFRGRR